MTIKTKGKTVKKIESPALNLFHRDIQLFLSHCKNINKLKAFIEEYKDLAICITEEFGEFIAVNQTFSKLYGYGADELIGEHCTLVVPPKYKPLAVEFHNMVVKAKELTPTICVNSNKKGENMILRIAPISFTDDKGDVYIISALEPKPRNSNHGSLKLKGSHRLVTVPETAC
jgi:PAS domain S-box-containing protein